MSSDQRSYRLASGVGACVALLVFASLFASHAVPSEAGPPAPQDGVSVTDPDRSETAGAIADSAPVLTSVAAAAERPASQEAAAGRDPARWAPGSDSSAELVQGTDSSPAPSSGQSEQNDPADTDDPVESDPPGEPEATEDPDEEARDCSPRFADDFTLTGTSPPEVSIELSQEAFECADEVGLAFAGDQPAISTLLGQDLAGPLLLADPETEDPLSEPLVAEIKRLEPQRVVVVGIDESLTAGALPDLEVEHLAIGTWPPYERVWILEDSQDWAWLSAIAQQFGVGVVTATGDLRALPGPVRQAIAAASEVKLLVDLGDDAAWQLEVVRRNEELPGGGLLLFDSEQDDESGDNSTNEDATNEGTDDEGANNATSQGADDDTSNDEKPARRMVAVYGHPSTRSLGVLGEQRPDVTVRRLRRIAAGYDADGVPVLPTFELIATVASASAGSDRDYSSMTDPDVLRPWIETAAANGVYVVLDLQPGRSTFLSQAKRYEEFLRMPHVGLALDPEWRLKPNQVHLRQIGTVDAAEINRVVDWLAGIVREEALPQKLLIVHQFRFSMITNRERIKTPAELAVLIHMDGQGSLSAKYNTWNALTGLDDADRFWWGWKNFYDEDSPVATPEQVLELTPNVVFVSFQ